MVTLRAVHSNSDRNGRDLPDAVDTASPTSQPGSTPLPIPTLPRPPPPLRARATCNRQVGGSLAGAAGELTRIELALL